MVKVYYTKIGEWTGFDGQKEERAVSDSKNQPCILKKVNEQRRSKILRCKNKKDKLRSLIAGLLLRFALEQEGIDYEKSEFVYGEHGKPMLLRYEYIQEDEHMDKPYRNLFFSLTHSEHYVACAISDENIGIDLEETNRKLFSPEKGNQLISMAKRICTKKEYAYFLNLPKEERTRAYVELWTRKESLAKADGRGLAIGFEQVEVLQREGFETGWITEDVCMSIYSSNITKHMCCYSYVKCEEWS